MNAELLPFRILTGIEVDILDDGALDQHEDLLGQLDVVVASVHSKLRMDAGPMTDGWWPRWPVRTSTCSGTAPAGCSRAGAGRSRCSTLKTVFAACRDHGVAVEINCRPERQDPPDRLLRLAAEAGCLFAIDTDAHAPGQLDWLDSGCARGRASGSSRTG